MLRPFIVEVIVNTVLAMGARRDAVDGAARRVQRQAGGQRGLEGAGVEVGQRGVDVHLLVVGEVGVGGGVEGHGGGHTHGADSGLELVGVHAHAAGDGDQLQAVGAVVAGVEVPVEDGVGAGGVDLAGAVDDVRPRLAVRGALQHEVAGHAAGVGVGVHAQAVDKGTRAAHLHGDGGGQQSGGERVVRGHAVIEDAGDGDRAGGAVIVTSYGYT